MISAWHPLFQGAIPPVYRQDRPDCSVFYAPGWIVVVPVALADRFAMGIGEPARAEWAAAFELRQHALEAQKAWEALRAAPFAPVALTLYLNNACNLNCAYCFSEPYRCRSERLSLETVRAAAQIVARNCRAQQRPLTVAFHGGGEPTLEYELILEVLAVLEEIAVRPELPLFRYLATNGVLSLQRASSLAQHFDMIGLSCDGPPEIQDRQRPLRRENRHASSWFVERTAEAVHRAGKPLHVRVTITPETIERQAEIAQYICETLQPQEIHVEPVYAVEGDGTNGRFTPEQAESYVDSFVLARRIAGKHGIAWLASGSRPGEVHSAYCNVWRNVLSLTPEGVATACFKLSEALSVREQRLELGSWNAGAKEFNLNPEEIERLRQTLPAEPEECALCFNRYHCVRQCPDGCLLTTGVISGGFRCRAQALLAHAFIQERVDALCSGKKLDGPLLIRMPEQM